MPDWLTRLVEHIAESQRDRLEASQQTLIFLARQGRKQAVCNRNSVHALPGNSINEDAGKVTARKWCCMCACTQSIFIARMYASALSVAGKATSILQTRALVGAAISDSAQLKGK